MTRTRTGSPRSAEPRSWWGRTIGALSSRQVNFILAVATFATVVTGLVSWAVGTGWGRWWTALHSVFGLLIVVLAPTKTTKSVRAGMRRRRTTRWLSIAFGVIVVATIAVGVAHSTGLWTGVGTWSALWTHLLLGFVAVPLLIWHLVARPARPRRVDLDRRLLVGGGAAGVVAVAATVAIEGGIRLVGTSGAERRFSGSHEVGSFDPGSMPVVSWFDDSAPTTPPEEWELTIDDSPVALSDLADRCRPVTAVLDCTGGWWSEQRWDAVALAEVLTGEATSFEVTSSTGYRRIFPMADAASLYLAVGYDGRALRRGHGGPVRIVAPGRRGFWWVKWVVAVEPTDRPAWMQSPFPLS